MANEPDRLFAVVARVAIPDHPAFQLRKGEIGLSVFELAAVEPPISEDELLESFRSESIVVYRTIERVVALGLLIAEIEGTETLSERLRDAHREIVPNPTMTRTQFKAAHKLLENQW